MADDYGGEMCMGIREGISRRLPCWAGEGAVREESQVVTNCVEGVTAARPNGAEASRGCGVGRVDDAVGR